MEAQSASNLICPIIKRAGRFIAVSVLIFATSMVSAQNEYWPIATLQPPGLDAQITPIAGIALAGDFAVTVYQPTATLGYRVFLRKRNAQGWDSPQLLVQGQPGEGDGVTVSADAGYIAIGLPKSDTFGRVDVYARNGTTWTLQQGIPAAPNLGFGGGTTPNFGYVISLRQSLLVVSSGLQVFSQSQFDTYRFDTSTGNWILGGHSIATLSQSVIGKTDGQRVASCFNNLCGSVLHDGNGHFSAEGGFSVQNVPAFEVDGAWIFVKPNTGELSAYQRSGTTWTLRQQFGQTGSFAMSGGNLVVANSSMVNFYRVDGTGIWQTTATRESPSPTGGITINQSFALGGIQSFIGQNGPWLASGTVEGVTEVASFRFGTAVSLAANRVWIGSPRHNSDFRAGAIWMEPLEGNSAAFPRFIDAPSFSASGVGFGQVLATDGARVAVVSIPDYVAAPLKIRVYSATSFSPVVADITAPPTATRAGVVDIAIHGNTLSLLRAVGGVDEVLVYENLAAGYVLQQSITLPPSAFKKVILLGDLLLVGQSQFQRVGGATGTFVQVGNVVNPPGVALNFGRMARYGTLLVVSTNSPAVGEPIARAFSFAASGWTYSGDVDQGSFPNAFCAYPAAGTFPDGGATLIACSTGKSLSIATQNSGGSDWTITRSADVAGLTTGPVSINAVAIEGDHVALGVPGQSKVVVVDITESIFAGGFDQ